MSDFNRTSAVWVCHEKHNKPFIKTEFRPLFRDAEFIEVRKTLKVQYRMEKNTRLNLSG